MKTTVKEVAKLMDLASVHLTSSPEDVKATVDTAKKFGIPIICVLPQYAPYVKQLLKGFTGVSMSNPVAFPCGAQKTFIKVAEIRDNIADGCKELDIAGNHGLLRSGYYKEYEEDIRACVNAAGEVPVKIIVEVGALNDEQLKRACDIVVRSGAAFFKTATGHYKEVPTPATIKKIKSYVGNDIKIKVSSGIRSLGILKEMVDLGVERFGVGLPWVLDIFKECEAE